MNHTLLEPIDMGYRVVRNDDGTSRFEPFRTVGEVDPRWWGLADALDDVYTELVSKRVGEDDGVGVVV